MASSRLDEFGRYTGNVSALRNGNWAAFLVTSHNTEVTFEGEILGKEA